MEESIILGTQGSASHYQDGLLVPGPRWSQSKDSHGRLTMTRRSYPNPLAGPEPHRVLPVRKNEEVGLKEEPGFRERSKPFFFSPPCSVPLKLPLSVYSNEQTPVNAQATIGTRCRQSRRHLDDCGHPSPLLFSLKPLRVGERPGHVSRAVRFRNLLLLVWFRPRLQQPEV